MSLDRLHSLLQMLLRAVIESGSAGSDNVNERDLYFAQQPGSLRQFLQAMIDQAQVEVIDGLYSLSQQGKQ